MEITQALLSAGANLGIQDERGLTPLCAACKGGCIEVARALLSAGAPVSPRRTKEGFSPLYAACAEGHVEVALALLSAGARVDSQDREGRSCKVKMRQPLWWVNSCEHAGSQGIIGTLNVCS